MADEKLVEELAEHLARRMFTEGRFLAAEGEPASWGDMPADQQRAWIEHVRQLTARPTLEWLAERGRPVPDGGLTRTEWAVTTPKGKQIQAVYDEAEARTCMIYGPRGVPVSRRVTNWPDGTRLTTPWAAVAPEPVPEETT